MLDDNFNAKIANFGGPMNSTQSDDENMFLPLKWMSVEGERFSSFPAKTEIQISN